MYFRIAADGVANDFVQQNRELGEDSDSKCIMSKHNFLLMQQKTLPQFRAHADVRFPFLRHGALLHERAVVLWGSEEDHPVADVVVHPFCHNYWPLNRKSHGIRVVLCLQMFT